MKNVGIDENRGKGKECSCKTEKRKNRGKRDGWCLEHMNLYHRNNIEQKLKRQLLAVKADLFSYLFIFTLSIFGVLL
jgi:hypothetical protein